MVTTDQGHEDAERILQTSRNARMKRIARWYLAQAAEEDQQEAERYAEEEAGKHPAE